MSATFPVESEILTRLQMKRAEDLGDLKKNVTKYKRQTTWIWGPYGKEAALRYAKKISAISGEDELTEGELRKRVTGLIKRYKGDAQDLEKLAEVFRKGVERKESMKSIRHTLISEIKQAAKR